MCPRIVEYITYGGISIINAIPAWLGGAIAIDLKVKVAVNEGFCKMDDFLLFILNYLEREFNSKINACINVESEVPSASGLKSNSAVAAGVIYAVTRFMGRDLNPVEVARLAAIITRAHGSSITGAFDDASAATLGGAVLTDNKSMRIIKQIPIGELKVLITGYREKKNLSNIDRLKSLSRIYRELFNIALNGDLWRATTINGILVAESLMYYRSLETIGAALGLGAVAAGVSGNGPSVFAIFKPGEEGPFIDYVEENWGYYLVTNPVNTRYIV